MLQLLTDSITMFFLTPSIFWLKIFKPSFTASYADSILENLALNCFPFHIFNFTFSFLDSVLKAKDNTVC